MSTTDTKFFTNEPDNDLYTRFANILKMHTQYFDVLVGYFRSSGFFKMYESLETVEKIRILVGLNVDKFSVKIIDRSSGEIMLAGVSAKDGKDAFGESIKSEFDNGETTSDIEKGVRTFIDWMKSGKLEMRLYTKAPLHAKVYIMRKDPEHSSEYGSVITGSSNFSAAGLMNNLEFNVELKDSSDVKFALNRFETLWKESIDINEIYIKTIENDTWLRDDITPYQLYIKTLYEFFNEEINADKELDLDKLLPDGFMRLQYQLDAVSQARKKLEAYNGVFISDVVGLGKTYICALLAASLRKSAWKLIICPPVLVDYWRSVLNEFGVTRFEVESLGKLDHIVEKHTNKYDYVFVDEAHRFRNSGTESYKNLHEICFGKKVVLISATPLNNYTTDIENQIYLFQAKQNGTINGLKNLEGFFRLLQSTLNKYPKESANYSEQLRKNSEIIRDKLLREVMIRRTRSEVKNYYKDDLSKQGLSFPETGAPERIIYEFDESTDAIFKETIKAISEFNYARYKPLTYLKNTEKYAKMLAAQHNMGGFMKGILVKRLESSFYAFKMTLNRFIMSYEQFIEMYKSGTVYISKKINVYDLLDDGDIEKLLYYVEQNDVIQISSKEFTPCFIADLEKDLATLKAFKTMWDMIDSDPKLEKFRNELCNNKHLAGNKAIVFTESKETADYLYENLSDIYGTRIVHYSGQSTPSLKLQIEDSFDPKNKGNNNDKYDLLITTDVLAEGVNLHRANVLINYDLPWNPTRIMQRVGRVNRVGTEHSHIYVFNFFPTAQSSRHMPLEKRILDKLQAFHTTLGDDIKYLSDAEEVTPQGLFDAMNIRPEEEGDNPELEYLALIRKIRDEQPELYNLVKRLPVKARSAKYGDVSNNCDYTVTMLRKGALKAFYRSNGIEAEYLTFMQAVELIKCEPDELHLRINSEYYNQLNANSDAFDELVIAETAITGEKPSIKGNDAKCINLFKAIRKDNRLTNEQENLIDILINRWENGEIPSKVAKDVINESKKPHESGDLIELLYCLLNHIPDIYKSPVSEKKSLVSGKKEIILSCFLRKDNKK